MVGSGQTSADSFGSGVSGTAALGASRFRQRQDITWGFLRTGISSNIQGKIKGLPRSPLRGSCCQIAWVGDFDSYGPVRLGANRLKNKLSARLKVLDTLGEAKALLERPKLYPDEDGVLKNRRKVSPRMIQPRRGRWETAGLQIQSQSARLSSPRLFVQRAPYSPMLSHEQKT